MPEIKGLIVRKYLIKLKINKQKKIPPFTLKIKKGARMFLLFSSDNEFYSMCENKFFLNGHCCHFSFLTVKTSKGSIYIYMLAIAQELLGRHTETSMHINDFQRKSYCKYDPPVVINRLVYLIYYTSETLSKNN